MAKEKQSLVVEIQTEFVKAGLKQAEKSIRNFNNFMNQVGTAAQTQFVNAFASATRAVVGFSRALVETGAGFEQAIQNVVALRGAGKDVEGMAEAFEMRARRLGATTAYTATEVAEGMLELSRAGLGTAKVLSAIEPALYLAGAQGSSLAASSKLMARTFAQFSLQAEDAAKVADTFTTAMQNSLLSMTSLDTSMRYAGGAAGSFGHDIQETTAAVALFMNQTGLGSTAGTQFRQVLLSLGAPTRKARKALEKYGIALDKVNPRKNDFAQIMTNLKPMMQDTSALVALVSKRSSGSLQKILQGFHGTTKAGEEYFNLLKKIKDQAGVSEATYKKMIDTVSGQYTILQSKIQEMFLTVFDSIRLDLKRLIKDGQVFVDKMTDTFAVLSIYIKSTFISVFQLVGGRISGMSDSFEQFAIKAAIRITQIIATLTNLASRLAELLPLLRDLAIAFASVFIATKIVAAGAAIKSLIVVVTGLTAAMYSAATGTATLSTGIKALGITAKVAGGAFTIILSALTYFALKAATTEDKIKDLTGSIEAGIERLRAVRAGFLQEEKEFVKNVAPETAISQYDKLLDTIDEVAARGMKIVDGKEVDLTEKELDAQKKVLEVVRQRIVSLQKMTSAEKLRQIQAGKLVSVNLAGYEAEEKMGRAVKANNTIKGERIALDIKTIKEMERLITTQDLFYRRADMNPLSRYGDAEQQVADLSKKYIELADSLKGSNKQIQNLAEMGIKQSQTYDQYVNNFLKIEEEKVKKVKEEINASKELTAQFNKEAKAFDLIASAHIKKTGSINAAERALAAEYETNKKNLKLYSQVMDITQVAKKGSGLFAKAEYQPLKFDDAGAVHFASKLTEIKAIGKDSMDGLIKGLESFRDLSTEGSEQYNHIVKMIGEAEEVQKGLNKAVTKGGKATRKDYVDPLRGMADFLAKNAASIAQMEDMARAYGNAVNENLQIARIENAFIKANVKLEKEKAKVEKDKSRLAAIRARMKLERKILEENRKAKAKETEYLVLEFKKFQDAMARTYRAEMKFYAKTSAKRLELQKRYLRYLKIAQDTVFRQEIKNARETFKAKKKEYDAEFGYKLDLLEQERKEEQKNIEHSLKSLEKLHEGKEGTLKLKENLDLLDKEYKVIAKTDKLKKKNAKRIAKNRKERKDTEKQIRRIAYSMERLNIETANAVEQNDRLYGAMKRKEMQEFQRMLVDIENKFVEDRINTRKREFDEWLQIQKMELAQYLDTEEKKLAADAAFAQARKNLEKTVINDFLHENNRYFKETLALRKNLLSVEKGLLNTILVAFGLTGLAQKRIDRIKKEIEYKKELSALLEKQEQQEREIAAIKPGEKLVVEAFEEQKKPSIFDREAMAGYKEVEGFLLKENEYYQLKQKQKIEQEELNKKFGIQKGILAKIVKFAKTGFKVILMAGAGLAAVYGKIFSKIKDGLMDLVSFMTDGMEFNPFSAIKQGVDELMAAEEELKQKQDELEEQYKAGRITDEEYQQGVVADKKSPEETGRKVVDDIFDRAMSFIDKVIEMAPIVMDRFAERLPALVQKIGQALPKLLKIIATYLPDIIMTIVDALIEAIPVILQTIMDLLPQILPKLLEFVKKLLMLLIDNLPMFIKLATQLIAGIIKALPSLIQAIIDAIPDILQGFIDSLDILIEALMEALPALIQRIIALFFKILLSPKFYKLLVKLFIELAVILAAGIIEGIVKALRDMLVEIFSGGLRETETFGDTPGPQYVPKSSAGMTARFAAGDYVIAAKEPMELMRQSLQAMGSKINMGVTKPVFSPEMSGSAGGAVSTNIAIVAEGRLLDSVQVMAMDRGHAPKMTKKIRKASGVKVGFDRGNYQKYANS